MKIFCIGDICGSGGCETLRQLLPSYKKENNIDLVIANGENSADGNGILPKSAESIFTSGVDIITGGNHTLQRTEVYSLLDENEWLLRPANFPLAAPGHGMCIMDFGYTSVAVINIQGTVFMDGLSSPFETADALIEQAKIQGAKMIVVDLHAEATSEKRALGFYLDGRVSAIFGTHTHCQTADEQILPNGTGYITDLGMTGAVQSVLGVDKDIIIDKFITKTNIRNRNAEGEQFLNGCVFDIDKKTGLATEVVRVCLR